MLKDTNQFSKSQTDDEKSKLIDYLLYQTHLMNENLNSENIKPIISMLKGLKTQDLSNSQHTQNYKNHNINLSTEHFQVSKDESTMPNTVDLSIETDQRRKLEIQQELVAIKNYEKEQKKYLMEQHMNRFKNFKTASSEEQIQIEKSKVQVRIPVNLKEEIIFNKKPNLESSENKAGILRQLKPHQDMTKEVCNENRDKYVYPPVRTPSQSNKRRIGQTPSNNSRSLNYKNESNTMHKRPQDKENCYKHSLVQQTKQPFNLNSSNFESNKPPKLARNKSFHRDCPKSPENYDFSKLKQNKYDKNSQRNSTSRSPIKQVFKQNNKNDSITTKKRTKVDSTSIMERLNQTMSITSTQRNQISGLKFNNTQQVNINYSENKSNDESYSENLIKMYQQHSIRNYDNYKEIKNIKESIPDTPKHNLTDYESKLLNRLNTCIVKKPLKQVSKIKAKHFIDVIAVGMDFFYNEAKVSKSENQMINTVTSRFVGDQYSSTNSAALLKINNTYNDDKRFYSETLYENDLDDEFNTEINIVKIKGSSEKAMSPKDRRFNDQIYNFKKHLKYKEIKEESQEDCKSISTGSLPQEKINLKSKCNTDRLVQENLNFMIKVSPLKKVNRVSQYQNDSDYKNSSRNDGDQTYRKTFENDEFSDLNSHIKTKENNEIKSTQRQRENNQEEKGSYQHFENNNATQTSYRNPNICKSNQTSFRNHDQNVGNQTSYRQNIANAEIQTSHRQDDNFNDIYFNNNKENLNKDQIIEYDSNLDNNSLQQNGIHNISREKISCGSKNFETESDEQIETPYPANIEIKGKENFSDEDSQCNSSILKKNYNNSQEKNYIENEQHNNETGFDLVNILEILREKNLITIKSDDASIKEKVLDIMQMLQKQENTENINQILNFKGDKENRLDNDRFGNNELSKTKNENKFVSSLKKRNESIQNFDYNAYTEKTENSKKVSFSDQESIIFLNKYSNFKSKKHRNNSQSSINLKSHVTNFKASKKNLTDKYKEETDDHQNINLDKKDNPCLANSNHIEIREKTDADDLSGYNAEDDTHQNNHQKQDTDQMTLNSIRELIFGVSIESSPQGIISKPHSKIKKAGQDIMHKQIDNDYCSTPIINSIPSSNINEISETHKIKNDQSRSVHQSNQENISKINAKSNQAESEILDIQKYINFSGHGDILKNLELTNEFQNEGNHEKNLKFIKSILSENLMFSDANKSFEKIKDLDKINFGDDLEHYKELLQNGYNDELLKKFSESNLDNFSRKKSAYKSDAGKSMSMLNFDKEALKEEDNDYGDQYYKDKKIINQIKESLLLQNSMNSECDRENQFASGLEEAINNKSGKLKSSGQIVNNDDQGNIYENLKIERTDFPNSKVSNNFTQQSTVSNSNPLSKNNVDDYPEKNAHSRKSYFDKDSDHTSEDKMNLSVANSNITNIDELKSELEQQWGKGWELELEKELENFELKNEGSNLLNCLNFNSESYKSQNSRANLSTENYYEQELLYGTNSSSNQNGNCGINKMNKVDTIIEEETQKSWTTRMSKQFDRGDILTNSSDKRTNMLTKDKMSEKNDIIFTNRLNEKTNIALSTTYRKKSVESTDDDKKNALTSVRNHKNKVQYLPKDNKISKEQAQIEAMSGKNLSISMKKNKREKSPKNSSAKKSKSKPSVSNMTEQPTLEDSLDKYDMDDLDSLAKYDNYDTAGQENVNSTNKKTDYTSVITKTDNLEEDSLAKYDEDLSQGSGEENSTSEDSGSMATYNSDDSRNKTTTIKQNSEAEDQIDFKKILLEQEDNDYASYKNFFENNQKKKHPVTSMNNNKKTNVLNIRKKGYQENIPPEEYKNQKQNFDVVQQLNKKDKSLFNNTVHGIKEFANMDDKVLNDFFKKLKC